jgi:hypothetical protein
MNNKFCIETGLSRKKTGYGKVSLKSKQHMNIFQWYEKVCLIKFKERHFVTLYIVSILWLVSPQWSYMLHYGVQIHRKHSDAFLSTTFLQTLESNQRWIFPKR